MLRFLDSVTIGGVKKTGEGYLVVDAFTARTGIQRYAGYEVGRPDLAVVKVYRDEKEVFAAKSLQSFSHVPITDNHPPVAVDSDNWKDYAVGETSDEVVRDGSRLRIPLILKDGAAIKNVEAGKRELSVGYSCDFMFETGMAPDGTTYDAVQRNIRANHIAVVDRGRAGSEFRIGDSLDGGWGAVPLEIRDTEPPMNTSPLNIRTIMVDGLSIQTTDQGAQAVEKLQGANTKLTADLASLQVGHKAALEAKDAEIGTLKVDLKKAQDAMPTGATLDKMVADRSALIEQVHKIAKDLNCDGKTDADIRREAVRVAMGDDMVKDASDAEITGMFKAAVRDGGEPVRFGTDTAAGAIRQSHTLPVSDRQKAVDAQAAYEKRLSTAYMNGPNGPAKAQ